LNWKPGWMIPPKTHPPEYGRSAHLRVYATAWPVTALGPGHRFVVWLAGCVRKCPGCISPEMQPPDAGYDVPVEVLTGRIRQVQVHLDGLTVSGGEPLDQPAGLAAFLARIREEHPDWSVIVFTGYRLEQILDDPIRQKAVFSGADVLIDGPFRQTMPSPHCLKGSANQRIIALTDRGRGLLRQCDPQTLPRFNAGLGSRKGIDMIIGIPPLEGTPLPGIPGKMSCDT